MSDEDNEEIEMRRAYEESSVGAIKGFRFWQPAKKLALFKLLVEKHDSRMIDGVVLDVQTANAIVTVHGALKPENQAKLLGEPLVRMAELAWKCLDRSSRKAS